VRRPADAAIVGVLVAGILAVSVSPIIARAGLDAVDGAGTGAGVLLAFGRLAVTTAITLPAWRGTRRAPAGTGRGVLPEGTGGRATLAGVLLGVHFGTWLPSLAFTSIAASTSIVTTGPVWVVLILWIGRGERPTAATASGVAVAVGGGIVLALGDVDGLQAGANPALGNALALVAAVSYAAHLLLAREVQARGLGLWRWNTIVAGIGALTLAPLVALTSGADAPYPVRFWVAVVGLALVSQVVGHSSLAWSVQWLSPTLVSVLILFEPVLSTLAAVVLYDEVPGAAVVVGGLVLVLGVGLTIAAERRRPAPLAA